MSAALTLAIVTRDLAFGLVTVLAAPSLGVAAIALALLASVGAGRAKWRGVPVARRPVLAR